MPTHPKRKISPSRAESPPDPEPDQSESADHDVASFIALCETENIAIPSTLATLPKMQAFIRHASLAFHCTHLPRAQVREHFASLFWLRAHHNSPDDMHLLPHILWCQLWALYNIPSHFHSAANNYIRLSQWSTCNSPATSSNFSHERMTGTDDSGASAGADPPHRNTLQRDYHPWQHKHLAQRSRHGVHENHSRSTLVVHLTTMRLLNHISTLQLSIRWALTMAVITIIILRKVITPWSPCVTLFPFDSN
jgi:hypothetical protein